MDISYFAMARGFVDLCAVIGWFSHRVLSWKLYQRRLSSYQSRQGGAFANELAEKREALREVEEALAVDAHGDLQAA